MKEFTESINLKNLAVKAIALLMILFFTGCTASDSPDPDLAKGFVDPGKEARPRGFWNWLNGDITRAGITRDLEEAKDKGFSGLVIWDTEAMRNPDEMIPAGPAFMGDESVELIHHAFNEAKRLDMTLGLVPSSGWNSGGSWVTPEMASKNLFYSSTVVSGPAQVNIELNFPEVPENCPMGPDGMPLWYMDVAVLAWPDAEDKRIPDLSEVLNLTDNFSGGKLTWSPPPGNWQVARFVCSNNGQHLIAASPNSKGLFIDFFDPEATRFHFEHFFNRLGIPKGGDPDIPLKTFDDDSMELHEGIQWTPKFAEWFQKYHGYDPVSWLPVLLGWTINNEDESERFNYDYLKTVSDLLIYSHFETGSEVCAEYGIQYAAQAGGPGPPIWNSNPVDALKALGNVAIPRGEFWMGNPRHIFLVKQIASAAHIYGKRYVSTESWTTWRRFRDGLLTRKMLVDRAFSEGLNYINVHIFAHSPEGEGFPGRSYHAGVDMNPQVVWWDKARPFFDYLARCSYMLQQGLYVADVAYYYGDQAPNFWPMYHHVPEKPLLEGLGTGYEYDVVNTDVILNRMSVKDGRIVFPDGMSYRILALPDQKDMPLEVLKKLEALVSEGATILGPKPSEVPGLGNVIAKTKELRELTDKMWGACDGTTVKENDYGQGKVVWGYTPEEWLKKQSVGPDFSSTDSRFADSFNFIHRETALSDIYFVSNKTLDHIDAECLFRVNGGRPQLWNPEDGSMKDQVVYTVEEDGVRMPVVLSPGGSVFVVFNKRTSQSGLLSVEKEKTGGSWNVPLEKVFTTGKKSIAIESWENTSYIIKGRKGKESKVTFSNIPEPELIRGEWNVEFDPEWGAPGEVVFPSLISWTDHENKGIKYYSGKGVYTKTISITENRIGENRNIYLDLGAVGEVTEVYINGESAGIYWKPPYRADITELVNPGENELKVEVMNLWVNRLTGDMALPEEERLTKTNIRSDGGSWLDNYTEWHVEPSGLLGPVRLLSSLELPVQ